MIFNIGDRIVVIGSLTTASYVQGLREIFYIDSSFRGEIVDLDDGEYWIRWLNNNQE